MRIDRVIILGAAGLGHSTRMQQLKQQLGASLIVDSWDGISELPAACLALARDMSVVPPPHSCVMSYAASLAEQTEVRIG